MFAVLIFGILVIIFLILLAVKGQNKANKFSDNYDSISIGMNESEVLSILGSPTTENLIGTNTKMFTWETSEWKGMCRGGTKSRSITIILKDGKVFSKSSKNLDMPGF